MQIFISYGRQDALEFAEKLSGWLREQGFEPWLDQKGGIVPGEPFDLRLERGISGSKLVIALISPSSVRQESYCRNEWLYAQSIEKPIIPIRLANINPPLVIINLHYEDAFDNPDLMFNKLLSVISEVSKNGKSRHRDWIINETDNLWWTHGNHNNFDIELSRYGELFTGRDWIFEKLDHWVNEEDSQIALITAEAGLGKSAIAAQLTTKLNVCSIHFCTSSIIKTCEPIDWIKEIVFQMAAQFDIYRTEIEKRSMTPVWSAPPESLFRSLVVDPLIKVKNDLYIENPWIFIIDSLDEAMSVTGHAMIDILAFSVDFLPSWVKIIATCRPDQSIISRLSIEGVKHIKIEADDSNNQNDLKLYVEKRIQRFGDILTQASSLSLVDKVSTISYGNFQFAKVLIDSLETSKKTDVISLNQLNQYPIGLIGLYDRIFRKRFSDLSVYRKNVLPILNCLIASKEPIDSKDLHTASKLDELDANNGILLISQFLNQTDLGLRLFHQSIIDWLSDFERSGEFAASKVNGQQLLSDYCWGQFSIGSTFFL